MSLMWQRVRDQRGNAPFSTMHESGLRALAVGRCSFPHNVRGQEGVIVHATGDTWYARLSKSHLVLRLRLPETPDT